MQQALKSLALAILAFLAALCGCRGPSPGAARSTPVEYLITRGPLEIRVSDAGIDYVAWRDLYVFGDAFENPRPVIEPRLITDNWKALARVESSESRVIEQSADRVRFTTCAVMAQISGPGRWRSEQEWTLEASGRLALLYRLREAAAPDKPVRNNRIIFIVDRKQVLSAEGGKQKGAQGMPITFIGSGGKGAAATFGGAAARQTAALRLPFAGHTITLGVGGNATHFETWNGGWRQTVNVDFPAPKPAVECRVDVSLSEIIGEGGTFTVQSMSPRPEPWLTAPIPSLPRPERPLRFVQCTPAINQWHGADKPNPDETRKLAAEMAKHFDVVELCIAWADWQYSKEWERDPAARQVADRLAAKAQEWIDIGHECGLKQALSLSFGAGEPGTGAQETSRLPQFQAETFKPETGEFVKEKKQFDWCSAKAREYAYEAWRAAASKIKGADFLFFNEPHFRLRPWYQAPFFSEAALADFRAWRRDPKARFPSKPYARPTPRTDNNATLADWRQWEDWAADVYARMISLQCRAVADANRDNPKYGGAIWFQNVQWVGPDWATDLDRICAIPEVRYVVCEYCTSADSPHWRKFKYYATQHGKFAASFVNIGWYDEKSPGRVRYQGTTTDFDAACRMGLAENAGMIALYPVDSFYPWSPAYNPERVAVWDKVMAEYMRR